MVKAASIKELDLRYGDIGNIQGRVYFLQNTKTPETYHEKHTNYLRVFTQINNVLWKLVTLLLMHSNTKILIKLKNMVEMRTDVSSFHQSLLLHVLTTILFPTGKHGSSGFIGPRLLNRYQLVLFSTTGVCRNVFKELTDKAVHTHNVPNCSVNHPALLKATGQLTPFKL